MKWNTNTIIFILLIAIGAMAYFYYDKESKIKEINNNTENRVAESLKIKSEEIENKYKFIIDTLKQKNKELREEISYAKYGGEEAKYRHQIKSNSDKTEEKLKIQKGEVYKHKKSGLVIYVKKNYYEEYVLVNMTMPDRETTEMQWDIGKYHYYWNAYKNELNQIMPTFIGDEHIELEWIFYKEKNK